MKVILTELSGVVLFEPRVYEDHRGFFYESYSRKTFGECTGYEGEFVQDNHSSSVRGVLRGIHYQIRQPQGKLIRVVNGEVFDVAVDLRRSSPTFGKWAGFRLSAANNRMAWIPVGFAHAYLALTPRVDVLYKTTDYYAPKHERTLLWNDPAVGIQWPLEGKPIMATKDERGALLKDAEVFE
jgi:dTDP-4-dehydrorhamnose 3,5-epimerase